MRSFLRLAGDVARSNVDPALRPFKLTFILTYRCQLRCTMCDIWKREPEGELTTDEIRRFFERNPSFTWLNLSGGEIFLRPDLPEILDAAVAGCPDLHVLDFPTHGQQTERIVAAAERLASSRVPRVFVTVSLDGPPSVHDRIRGVQGSWDRAVETFSELRRIRRRGFRPFLGMTLQPENVGAFDALVESVRRHVPDLDAREVHVNLVHESSHYYGNEGVAKLDPERAIEAMRRVRRARGKGWHLHPVDWLERRYQKLAERWIERGTTPLPCRAVRSSIFVDSFGEVRPCTIWDRPLGSLREFDFDLARLLASAEAGAAADDATHRRCPQCWTPCEAYPTLLAHALPKRGAAAR